MNKDAKRIDVERTETGGLGLYYQDGDLRTCAGYAIADRSAGAVTLYLHRGAVVSSADVVRLGAQAALLAGIEGPDTYIKGA